MTNPDRPELTGAVRDYVSDAADTPEVEKLEVKVTVQPPELFEDNTGEVIEVGSTNNYTVVFRTKDGIHEYVIRDETGEKVKANRKFPVFSLTGADIGAVLGRKNKSYLDWSTRPQSTDLSIQDFANITGLSVEETNELKARLITQFKPQMHYVDSSTLNPYNEVILDLASVVHSDSSKSVLVFQRGKKLFVYKTVDSNGMILHPDQWELVTVQDNGKITPQELQQYPFLREFLETSKGRPVEGLDVAIDADRGILNVIDTKKNVRLYSDAAAGYAVDPVDKKTVYYLDPATRELKSFSADQASLTQTKVETRPLPFSGVVKDLKFDPQGNFFLITVEDGGSSKLLIVEKDTLSVSAEIADVAGDVDVDNLGNIYFVDKNKRLRLANTNFMTFARGGLEQARQEKREKLLKLRERLATIDITKLTDEAKAQLPPEAQTEEQVFRSLRQQLEERFGPMVAGATSVEELEQLGFQLDALKQDPELGSHQEIFAPLDDRIRKKANSIKTEQFTSELDGFDSQLEGVTSARQALDLEQQFTGLLQHRREILIADPQHRKSIDQRLRNVEAKKQELAARFAGEISGTLEQLWQSVTERIGETGTPEELSAVGSEPEVMEFEQLLGQLTDAKLRQTWRQRYRVAIAERRSALAEKVKSAEEAERTRAAQSLEESREIFDEVQHTLDTEIADPKELASWVRGNPLLTRYRAKLLSLPEKIRLAEEARLDSLLKQRSRDLEHRVALNVPKKGGEVNFGRETFPVFQDVPIVWQPKVVPLAEGSDYGYLVFRDSLGREFRPNIGSVPVDSEDELTQRTIALTRGSAEKYFESLKRRVPEYDAKWVLNDFNRGVLSEIAKLSKVQVNEHRGILILEGEAGTGKNVLVDMFAHFTNRETFTFSCNFQTEKEDITYAFKFDPVKGTYQVDSRLIEMLQTPGSVIVLDEINTLPPGVAKMLNPLLDYRRTLFLPDGRQVKAHESVLIAGTMNPQHYLGVKPLSQEVKSRARILSVNYPPEKADSRYTSYEAEILAKYVDALEGIGQEEFTLLWDYVVNGDTTNGGDKFLTDERKEAVNKLSQVIKTANRIREAYAAFRTGKSNNVVEFVFSLRESVDIASELNHVKDVKQAIRDVVLPKISDPAEKVRIGTIIDEV